VKVTFEQLRSTLAAHLNRNQVVANNLANVNTSGFKRDVMFSEVLEGEQGAQVENHITTDYTQGVINQTNNPLDVALSGRGFFVVENGDGEAYTRDGHFNRDGDGYLVNSAGMHVLGDTGRIDLQSDRYGNGEIRITANGEIYQGDHFLDRLKIVDFEDTDRLRKLGGNLLAADPRLAQPVETPQILQGNLEASNVHAVHEMVSLIEIERSFQSAQQAMRTLDGALNKAANELGRYR